jgi:hypothetical protein
MSLELVKFNEDGQAFIDFDSLLLITNNEFSEVIQRAYASAKTWVEKNNKGSVYVDVQVKELSAITNKHVDVMISYQGSVERFCFVEVDDGGSYFDHYRIGITGIRKMFDFYVRSVGGL